MLRSVSVREAGGSKSAGHITIPSGSMRDLEGLDKQQTVAAPLGPSRAARDEIMHHITY